LSIFITFEGGEGSGKSTQAEALAKRLQSVGVPVLLTHEPGGTPMGEQIKEWLKGKASKGKKNSVEINLDPQTELLLFNAARAQLVSKVIKPALEKDTVVICDRFYHSTIAYQGHGRGLDLDLVKSVIELATGGLKPNLTILMDIDVQKGLARKELLDRFEREELEFHQRVRQSYLGMAHKDPQRWLVVNASLDKQEVEQLIWDWVEQLLPAMRRMGKKEGEVGKEIAIPDKKDETQITVAQEKGVVHGARPAATQVVKIEALSPPMEVASMTGPIVEVGGDEPGTPAAQGERVGKEAKPPKKKSAAKPKKGTKNRVAKKQGT
jgi:dTMP kinase